MLLLVQSSTVVLILYFATAEGLDSAVNATYGILTNDVVAKSKCTLELEDAAVVEKVDQFVEEGMRLIKYMFNVREDRGPFSPHREDHTLIIKPYTLMLALEGSGTSLLTLKEYFKPMSLYTLGYGVTELDVALIQTPFDCLENVTGEDLEVELKQMILRKFGNTTSEISSGRTVCSQHIRQTGPGIGEAIYSCCKLELGNMLHCSDLEESVWITILFTVVLVLQVVFVLYSPNFAPTGGRMGTRFIDYLYKPQVPLKLNVVTVDSNKEISDKNFIKTRQFSFIQLAKLKEHLRSLSPEILYTVFVSKVFLSVRASKIVPEGYSPVSVIKFIRNFFVRCKMRKDLPALKGCCHANMFRKCGCIEVPWLQFLTLTMRTVLAFLVIIPWLCRMWFYYAFEVDTVQILTEKLKKNNLRQSYSGSLVLYLTPNHLFFILMYVGVLLSLAVFIFLPPVAKRKLKFTIQTSLKNMNKTNKLDSFVSFIAHLLYPLEECGALGILILPLWLVTVPFGIIILSYLIFPIFNLTVRLLMNFIYYTVKFINPEVYQTLEPRNRLLARLCLRLRRWSDDVIVVNRFEARSRTNMMLHVISLTMCMLTAFVLVVLVVECIAFYVECAIYIIIGIILNSKNVMKYLSLLVLIVWYAIDCFSAVSDRYRNFGKVVNNEIQGKVGDIVKTVAMCAKENQKEEAFTVKSMNEGEKEKMTVVAGTEGYLKWDAKRLLLFLDTEDIPYMPKDFLFKAGKLGHFCCPGPVYMMYTKALIELIWITLFLGFVMLIIFAFGDANNISGPNQTLAALASGFLPFVFRKFLIKSHSGPSLDKSNITWQATLSEAIEKYTKRWTFSDLEILASEPTDSIDTPDMASSSQPKTVNFTQKLPENVDLVVKIHKSVNIRDDRLEFWARKPAVPQSETVYIWTEPHKEGACESIEMTEI